MTDKRNRLTLATSGVDAWNSRRMGLDQVGHLGGLDDPFDLDLSGADLERAELSGVNLEDCNLRGANLRSANLSGARMSMSELKDANLQGALLTQADFSLSTLDGCDFSGASIGDTRFIRVDLSMCIGLLKVKHNYSSIIDTSTLVRTAQGLRSRPGHSLEVWTFLVNAGVPDFLLKPLGLREADAN